MKHFATITVIGRDKTGVIARVTNFLFEQHANIEALEEQVTRGQNDIQNLISATDVGVLFLDRQLRIRRFTPRITDLFAIVAGGLLLAGLGAMLSWHLIEAPVLHRRERILKAISRY